MVCWFLTGNDTILVLIFFSTTRNLAFSVVDLSSLKLYPRSLCSIHFPISIVALSRSVLFSSMKFAPKIIFLVRDPDGFGPAISISLIPSPDSNLTRSESTFELSLANYGITDEKASGDKINFLDPQGSPKVSMLLIPNYGPPIAACAVREILSAISSGNVSDQPAIILPFIMKARKFNREMTNLSSSRQEVTLHAAEIGATTEFTRALVAGIANVSSSLQLNSEPLACLLHMVRVLGVPTVLLIASDGQNQKERSTDYEIEALCKVGQFMADLLGFSFSKDGLQHKQVERSRPAQEPWRALYL